MRMGSKGAMASAIASFVTPLLLGCGGLSDNEPPAPPPPPPPPAVEPAPLPEPYSQPPPPQSSAQPPSQPPPQAPTGQAEQPGQSEQPAPPAQAPLVYSYPTGQWVFTVDRGWVWVPSGTTTTDVEGVPYAYLYTPGLGWTWYLSPWGWGPYHYGMWFRHPWHPYGWHGSWVAHPRVIHRLGPGFHRGRR